MLRLPDLCILDWTRTLQCQQRVESVAPTSPPQRRPLTAQEWNYLRDYSGGADTWKLYASFSTKENQSSNRFSGSQSSYPSLCGGHFRWSRRRHNGGRSRTIVGRSDPSLHLSEGSSTRGRSDVGNGVSPPKTLSLPSLLDNVSASSGAASVVTLGQEL